MKRSLIALLSLTGLVAALPATAQFRKAEDAIEYSQSAFILISNHFGRVAAMAQGKVPFDAKLAADDLHHLRLAAVMTLEDTPRRARLLLLHGIRAAVLQRIARIAADIPPFNPQHGLTRAVVQEQLMRLDIPAAVKSLTDLFPLAESEPLRGASWGEPATYRADVAHGHAVEHETLFAPLLDLHRLTLDITSAINHEIGACG